MKGFVPAVQAFFGLINNRAGPGILIAAGETHITNAWQRYITCKGLGKCSHYQQHHLEVNHATKGSGTV